MPLQLDSLIPFSAPIEQAVNPLIVIEYTSVLGLQEVTVLNSPDAL